MAAPVYIEKAVAQALIASPVVKAVCGGKVFPLKIPQGTKLPCVVYQRGHTGPDSTIQGYASEGVTLVINSFALTYEEAKRLALAVRECMAAAPINAIFRGERDIYNNDADVFGVTAEYACQQTGGYCYESM